jgi:hypothetical protein
LSAYFGVGEPEIKLVEGFKRRICYFFLFRNLSQKLNLSERHNRSGFAETGF